MVTREHPEILRALTADLADHDLWTIDDADGHHRYYVTRRREGSRTNPPNGVSGWQTTRRAALAQAREAL